MANKREENLEPVGNEKIKENKLNKEEKEKISNIVEEAKQNGNITYADLATKLNEVNPENLDDVFDEFEKVGIDLSGRFLMESHQMILMKNQTSKI